MSETASPDGAPPTLTATAPIGPEHSDHALLLNALDAEVAASLVPGRSTTLGSDLWPYALKYSRSTDDHLLICRPRTTEAVAAAIGYAREHGLSVLTVGAGSNVVGALDTAADLLLSTERLDHVELDEVSQVVTVGAGVNAAALEQQLNERGLTLGIYPQSLRISTIGGWVSTRATGTYSARYGGVERALVGMTAVLATGQVVTIAPRVRAPGGLDALSLALGTEGSLMAVTKVSLAVRRRLPERRIAASFPDFASGLRGQRELIQRELPIGLLRLYNERESDVILPAELSGRHTVLLSVTVTGEGALLDAAAKVVEQCLADQGASPLPATAADRWFEHRYSAETLMQTRNEPPLTFFDTIEVSVPWAGASAAAADLEAAMPEHCTTFHMHSSHVYPTGTCLYMIFYIDADDDTSLRERWAACWTTAIGISQRHGGGFGHHHGVGALRAGFYELTDDGALHAQVKAALDPDRTLRARALERPVVLEAPQEH